MPVDESVQKKIDNSNLRRAPGDLRVWGHALRGRKPLSFLESYSRGARRKPKSALDDWTRRLAADDDPSALEPADAKTHTLYLVFHADALSI